MTKPLSIVFLLISLCLISCKEKNRVIDGYITNSQTRYKLASSHSYPTIYFYGKIKNTSSSPLEIVYESRDLVSSNVKQFFWVVENDTLQLLCYQPNYPPGEKDVKLSPDSSLSIGLRPHLLHFFEDNKNQESDSTYYKELLKNYSEKGSIYFVDRQNNWNLINRNNTFRTLEGVTQLK